MSELLEIAKLQAKGANRVVGGAKVLGGVIGGAAGGVGGLRASQEALIRGYGAKTHGGALAQNMASLGLGATAGSAAGSKVAGKVTGRVVRGKKVVEPKRADGKVKQKVNEAKTLVRRYPKSSAAVAGGAAAGGAYAYHRKRR